MEKDTVFWDSGLKGFGVRVYPSGSKVYVVQSRGPRGTSRVTWAGTGVISADQARRRAASMIARIKAGEEPAPKRSARREARLTVAELAGRYFREHVEVRCKPSSARSTRQVVDKHILPALGKLPHLRARTPPRQQSALPPRATHPRPPTRRSIRCRGMLNRAEAWGLAPPGGNPCRFVARYRTRKRNGS